DRSALLAHLEHEPLGRPLARGVHEDARARDREGTRRELGRRSRILGEPEGELALLVAQSIRRARRAGVLRRVPLLRDRIRAAAQRASPRRQRRAPEPLLPASPRLAPELEGDASLVLVRREHEALVAPDALLPDRRERARHRGETDPPRTLVFSGGAR